MINKFSKLNSHLKNLNRKTLISKADLKLTSNFGQILPKKKGTPKSEILERTKDIIPESSKENIFFKDIMSLLQE